MASLRANAPERRPPLCQAGAVATRTSGVASVAAGPGSDLSEVLATGDRSAALDFVAAPECPPGPAALRSASATKVRGRPRQTVGAFRHRSAPFLPLPAASFRAYDRPRSSWRLLLSAAMCSAWLSRRLPARLSRYRMMSPLLISVGAVPV